MSPSPVSELDRLRAENAELRGELDEYRRQEGERVVSEREGRMIHAARIGLDLNPAECRLLLALIGRAPRICLIETLDGVIRLGDPGEAPARTLVASRVCTLRSKLRRGLPGLSIETVWGQGYRVTTGQAAEVKAWFDAHV